MTYAALVVLGLLLPPVLFDLAFRPGIRRIGLRNVARRPGEAALVIVGSLLATALIVASFIVGDSLRTSYAFRAESGLGPLDMLVASTDINGDLEALADASDEGDTIESLMPVVQGEINVANVNGKVEPRVTFWEADLEELKAFGNDPEAGGVVEVPDDLSGTDVVINQALADDLLVTVGDPINVVAGNTAIEYTVAAVVPGRGLAGYASVIGGPGGFSQSQLNSDDVFMDLIAVSNVGGTYEGRDATPESESHIRSVLGEDTSISNVKDRALGRADRIGDDTTSQFSTVGGFSVAAGILLMVNLFVMLAAERKVDLGTMRAIGLQRGHTRRAFSVEGLVYGLAATAFGLVVGIGVAWAVMAVADNAFGPADEVEIRLGLKWTSLFSGAVIGLAITQLTVLLTALRIVRINIVSALKGAVEPRRVRQSAVRVIFGLLVAAAGLVLWLVAPDNQIVALVAPVMMAVGLVPAMSRLIGHKLALLIGCGFGIFWASSVFGLLSETYEDPAIELFLLQGIALVGLSVTILAAFDGWLMAGIHKLTSGSVASRLGLSNPMARPVRTALLVSMYALVILTVTFTAILNTAFTNEAPKSAAKAGGSYDVFVLSSALGPLDREDLTSRNDIDDAVEVVSGLVLIESAIMDADDEGLELGDPGAPDPDEAVPVGRYVSLVSEDFAANGPPVLVERSSDYDTDNAAWAALAAEESAAIVPVWRGMDVGDTFEVEDGAGVRTEVEVIGLNDWNWIGGFGMFISDQHGDALVPEVSPFRRHYVVAADGVDLDQLVEDLEIDFAKNGTDAGSFRGRIDEQAAESAAFIEILQGYLGLGLLIGIAGLCVVLIRGVRERRQQLGMLRAIGFRSEMLRNSFVIEALFIGAQGVALGIGLGSLSAWQVLTRSNAFDGELEFSVPGQWLTGLAVLAIGASVLAGLLPAIRAGRLQPAEALRLPG